MRYFHLCLIAALVAISACGSDDGTGSTRIDGFSVTTTTFQETNADFTQDILLNIKGVITEPVSIAYRFEDNEAVQGADFTGASGTVQLAPGTTTSTLSFVIHGDSDFELTETLNMYVTYEGQETGFILTINDNDNLPQNLDRDDDGVYTPLVYPSMTPVWSDEFDGTVLNTSDWNYELGDGCAQGICGWGNNELEIYTDASENIAVADGRLTITATKEGNDDFYSARITTQDKVEFTFGRIDVRARLPKGQGIWPAIWLLGANINEVSWPACGEIDLMELVGHEPAKSHGTVHYDYNGYQTSTGSYSLQNGDFSDEFHVFTLVWDKDKISWAVDNKIFKTVVRSANETYPFNNDFFMIMNVAVGGNWPGNPDATTVFPQEMVVDYIRVFR